MTKWKKDETTFQVKVLTLNNRDGSHTKMCTIPSPLAKWFGECDTVQFKITGDGLVTVEPIRLDCLASRSDSVVHIGE